MAFSFRSSDTPAEYEICFRMNARSGYGPAPGNPIVPVEINLTHTLDLFDNKKATDLKVKPIEAEFSRLEGVMRSVVNEANNLLRVEHAMRSVNGTRAMENSMMLMVHFSNVENTFNLVKYLSIMSVLVFVGLNVYQIFYMKRYFKSKKLI